MFGAEREKIGHADRLHQTRTERAPWCSFTIAEEIAQESHCGAWVERVAHRLHRLAGMEKREGQGGGNDRGPCHLKGVVSQIAELT